VGLEALAQQGLTARQIADRTSLPAGEIELALKLRDGTHPIPSIEAIRQ
jgi:fructosamine-3-kinase